MIWCIQAVDFPTFFLDSDIQGIVNAQHAEQIARDMLQPGRTSEIHVTASPAEYIRKQADSM